VINYGVVPGAVMAHYDWLQKFKYCNQTLMDFVQPALGQK